MKKGIYTALITPFDNDNNVDYVALGQIVKMQIDAGVSGIVALGTTAESPTLTNSEKEKILDFVIEAAQGKIAIVAGAGTNCSSTTIEQIEWLNTKNIDAVLLSLPAYNKPNKSGLKKHVEMCCKASVHPIILYYVPSRTGQVLSAKLLKTLCRNKKIVGIKDASGNLDLFFECTLFKKNFAVFSGNDDQFFQSLCLGGSGVVSVASNAIPKTMVQIMSLFLNGKTEQSKQLFLKHLSLIKLMFSETNPVPIKYIMQQLSLCYSNVRYPLGQLSRKNKTKTDLAIKKRN